jgi:hypothetical protein
LWNEIRIPEIGDRKPERIGFVAFSKVFSFRNPVSGFRNRALLDPGNFA